MSSERRFKLLIQMDFPPNHDLTTPLLYAKAITYYKELSDKVSQSDDSGVDLILPHETICQQPFGQKSATELNLYVKCCMIDTHTNKPTGYYMYARSSIYKYGLSLANSVGIIDSGYRGHLKAMVYTHNNAVVLEKNIRLFQICAPDLSPLSVELVGSLPQSERGENGFGSSGR